MSILITNDIILLTYNQFVDQSGEDNDPSIFSYERWCDICNDPEWHKVYLPYNCDLITLNLWSNSFESAEAYGNDIYCRTVGDHLAYTHKLNKEVS